MEPVVTENVLPVYFTSPPYNVAEGKAETLFLSYCTNGQRLEWIRRGCVTVTTPNHSYQLSRGGELIRLGKSNTASRHYCIMLLNPSRSASEHLPVCDKLLTIKLSILAKDKRLESILHAQDPYNFTTF